MNDEESRKIDQDFFNAIGVEETGITLDDDENLDTPTTQTITEEIVEKKPNDEQKTEPQEGDANEEKKQEEPNKDEGDRSDGVSDEQSVNKSKEESKESDAATAETPDRSTTTETEKEGQQENK